MMNFFTKLLTPVFVALGMVNPTPVVETPTPDVQVQQELIDLRQKVQELELEKLNEEETQTETVEEVEIQVPKTKAVEVKKEVVTPVSVVVPDTTVETKPEPVVIKKMTTSEFNTLLASDSNLSRSYNKAQITKPKLSCSVGYNYGLWDQSASIAERISQKKSGLVKVITENYKSSKDDRREYENLIEWVTGVSSFSQGYSQEVQDYVMANTPNPETHQFDFSDFNTNNECILEAEKIITILMEERLREDESDLAKQQWIASEVAKARTRRVAQVYIDTEIQRIYQTAETMDFGATKRELINANIQKLNELITLFKRS